MSPTRSLFRFELAAARRGRAVPLVALGFALAAMTITLVGLAAGGVVAVQGFARTSVSLLQLVVWAVPLVALLTGAVAGSECHDLEFVVALPLPRRSVVLARWLAWMVILGGALLLGLGGAGILIALLSGGADGWRYLRLIGVTGLVLAASLAIGLAVGVAARTRLRALGVAMAVWLVLVVGVDLVAIGALAMLPPHRAGWGLTLLLMADPIDSARALGLGLFHADVVAGPTGAALRRVLGGAGAWVLAAAMVAWTVVPLALAGRRFGRSDL